MQVHVRVQAEDFDPQIELDALTDGQPDVGAIVSFIGRCRSESGTLAALELEHYAGMAETEITRIAQNALERFQLNGIAAIHRYGKIPVGDNIVLVIASSTHRQAAFDGANYLMDFLKTSAPFWKKEHHIDGSEGSWVDAKDIDDEARNRWE